jgi:hypothetical protein
MLICSTKLTPSCDIKIKISRCEISGSHGDEYEDGYLPGCFAV